MKGIEVPERTEDFTADPVELFFDLAYVFAMSQLVGRLIGDPTWAGAGKTALLFGLLWLPWSQFTWSANAVSGNGRGVRLLFLVGTAASVPMAASMSSAYGSGGPVFALSLVVIVVLGMATMALAADSGTGYQRAVARWIGPNLLSLVLLVVGATLDGSARVACWAAALVVIVAAMILAGGGEWIIRTGHFAERHGLIVIVALGEVIVAIGLPVAESLEEGGGLSTQAVVALFASGLFAGLLWWAYFDRPSPAIEQRAADLEGDRQRGRFVRDVYTWAHAPIVAGIILAAAALEEIALHPGDPVETSFRVMLFGGLGLAVLGVASAVGRAFGVFATERVAAGVVVGLVLVVGGSWNGTLVLVLVDVVIAAALFVEHLRIER